MLKKYSPEKLSIRSDGRAMDPGGTAAPHKPRQRGGRPRQVDMREVLNTFGISIGVGVNGICCPTSSSPKSTAYDYFAQWRDDGTWGR